MASYRGTIVSTRSPEETFDYMADFANAADWDPGTAWAEHIDDGAVVRLLASVHDGGEIRLIAGRAAGVDHVPLA